MRRQLLVGLPMAAEDLFTVSYNAESKNASATTMAALGAPSGEPTLAPARGRQQQAGEHEEHHHGRGQQQRSRGWPVTRSGKMPMLKCFSPPSEPRTEPTPWSLMLPSMATNGPPTTAQSCGTTSGREGTWGNKA